MICSDVSTKIIIILLNDSVELDLDNKSEQLRRYEICVWSDNFI